MIGDFLTDIKAFGGTPVFVFAIAFSFLVGFELLALQLFVGYVVSMALTALVRTFYFRRRPDKTGYRGFLSRLDASSFPSLHAMRAFVLATLLYLRFPGVWVGFLLVVFALSTAVIRVVTKRHHVSDVVVGSVLGIVLGVLINVYIA